MPVHAVTRAGEGFRGDGGGGGGCGHDWGTRLRHKGSRCMSWAVLRAWLEGESTVWARVDGARRGWYRVRPSEDGCALVTVANPLLMYFVFCRARGFVIGVAHESRSCSARAS